MSKADTLGKRIARARILAGAGRGKPFTQTELARVVGVTPPTVSQWESGASEPPLATIVRIAAALGVAPAYLAFGEGAAEQQRTPLASYQIPDHIASVVTGAPPAQEPVQEPKSAQRPRAKSAKGKR